MRIAVTNASGEPAGRKIDLSNWDGDTVSRFLDFLYIGNYQVPNPDPLLPGEVSEEPVSESDFSEREVHTPDTVITESTVQRDESDDDLPRPLTPLHVFRDYHEHGDIPNPPQYGNVEQLFGSLFPPRTNNYSIVLLAHAKVYALAQCNQVESLQKMAIQRLLSILASPHWQAVEPNSHMASTIIELLSYVYTHTDSPGASKESLRKILSQYAALNFPALLSSAEMMDLIGQGGELAKDMISKVCRRLVDSERKLADSEVELTTSRRDRSNNEATVYDVQVERERISALRMTIADLQNSLEEERRAKGEVQALLKEKERQLEISVNAIRVAKRPIVSSWLCFWAGVVTFLLFILLCDIAGRHEL